MMTKSQKKCYIIAGPNGAGKTTFALQYLPQLTNCNNFINADMIAAGLSPLAPDKSQIKAARLFLSEIKKYTSKTQTFAFETTLSGKSYHNMIKKMQKENWKIELIYLWIPSIAFSALRVQERVQEGGHNIPRDAIERRYSKSIKNLLHLYMPICDHVLCFDNSTPDLHIIFEKDKKGIIVQKEEIYLTMKAISNGH